MNQSEFTILLKKQLEEFNRDLSIDFGVNICERLLPDYINFSIKNQWGDPTLLKDAIQYCKDSGTEKQQSYELKKLIKKVDINIPDTEDFGDYDGSYALNSSASILELLQYLLDEDINHLLNISTYMLDHIDFKIAEGGTNLTYEQWDNHPEIIKERLFQLQITNNVV